MIFWPVLLNRLIVHSSGESQMNQVKRSSLKYVALCVSAVALGACASDGGTKSTATGKSWTTTELTQALANPSRPQADRDRDADRKPAELMAFFGVQKGMTALDVIAAAGYLSESLSVAVGPNGKVYLQNPPAMLQMRGGAAAKEIEARLANGRLPNIVRVDSDFPAAAIPAGSVDFAITAMNLHDLYNRSPAAATSAVKSVYDTLKPGGAFGVIDHLGVAGADNAKLHRMTKEQAIEVAKAAGFVVEKESNLLAHAADDHTKGPFDPSLRGKTDQFVLLLRKPK
jgi:predicted methyltransferase